MASALRLITANLLNGRASAEALAGLVQSAAADVVAVQELGWEQAEALSSVLPHGRLEPADDYSGMGLALRHPAASLSRLALPYRDARIARLEPAAWSALERPLEIVNVHFAAPTARPWRRHLAYRRAQLAGLHRHFDAQPDAARALVGDFNATPLWPVYRSLAARFDDLPARHARERGAPLRATWPAWLPRGPLLRIDHCFGHALEVASARAVPLPGSDHLALVVDLRVKGSAGP